MRRLDFWPLLLYIEVVIGNMLSGYLQKLGGWSLPTLQLLLLGALDLRTDDQPLPKPPTLKSQSLLAYLATHRQQPQSRERLADLFWGDQPERKARSSLSTALWHIRRCFPYGEPILSDPHTVQFDPACDLWLDFEAFESYASAEDTASLEAGLALYRGDFMEGHYDDWILNYRYRLESLFSEALARLMVRYEAGGEYDGALAAALLFVLFSVLGRGKTPILSAAIFALFALALYIPGGYYMETWMYNRRQKRKQPATRQGRK